MKALEIILLFSLLLGIIHCYTYTNPVFNHPFAGEFFLFITKYD